MEVVLSCCSASLSSSLGRRPQLFRKIYIIITPKPSSSARPPRVLPIMAPVLMPALASGFVFVELTPAVGKGVPLFV